MYRAVIALVDASRARLFSYDRTADEAGLHEDLVERADFVNPARRKRPSELFSDTRPGSSRVNGRQYAFDDHRDHHIATMDAEFARMIMASLRELVDEVAARRVIIAAGPRMLGKLRAAAPGLLPDDVELLELPNDLVRLERAELLDQLGKHDLVPPPSATHARW